MKRTDDGRLSGSGGDDVYDSVSSAIRRADAYLNETLDVDSMGACSCPLPTCTTNAVED
jgi:hypothetical protein